ncbi:hypothetical protein [Desulfohalobium retbaense]|jgi:hypothetical protein|uniref:Uncharacterized protein n=1 Tax=Desulfohalobium retbaense (strain ATCC 49708 / DSM 5692 / JCM 16813 / HR100) TaxID=485915 RepID=C8X3S4_DESRD|nr:hypothetical protein [Desulfohalobium retbaense]ACV69071.1 hypothetical protein Dret_1787 [Desulfohalobium retbaense DSM 5692]
MRYGVLIGLVCIFLSAVPLWAEAGSGDPVAVCCCLHSPERAQTYAAQMAEAVPGLEYTLEYAAEDDECQGVTIWISHPEMDGDALCEAVFQSLHTELTCPKE